jgi:hypothetical protein
MDFDNLLKLRLAVARYGEMDIARWWNTQGLLGRNGAILFSRGFPATHRLAQARVVMSVAENRCKDVFDTSNFITLWRLTPEIEDQFENQWASWLDRIEELLPFFNRLEKLQSGALRDFLTDQNLASDEVIASVLKLNKLADGRAVALPATTSLNDEVVTMLAVGFLKGEIGSPVIPYIKDIKLKD